MQQVTFTGFSAYNMASGNTSVAAPDSLPQLPYFNIQYSVFGLDAADATATFQGSLDNSAWVDIASKTLTQPNAFVINTLPSTTEVVVTGNATAEIAANPMFYIDGSTSNDSRYTASSADLQTLLDYSNLVGVFTIGETVTAAPSGATGVVVFKTGTASLRVNAVTGTFTNADTLAGGTSLATADVDTATVVTSIATTGLTAEAAAGNVWAAKQFNEVIDTNDTIWNYYRIYVDVNSVTEGFLFSSGIGKTYLR